MRLFSLNGGYVALFVILNSEIDNAQIYSPLTSATAGGANAASAPYRRIRRAGRVTQMQHLSDFLLVLLD